MNPSPLSDVRAPLELTSMRSEEDSQRVSPSHSVWGGQRQRLRRRGEKKDVAPSGASVLAAIVPSQTFMSHIYSLLSDTAPPAPNLP